LRHFAGVPSAGSEEPYEMQVHRSVVFGTIEAHSPGYRAGLCNPESRDETKN
jgi:hypothetical protein